MGGGFVILLIIFLVIRTMKNIEKDNQKKAAQQQPPAQQRPVPVPERKGDPRFPDYYEEAPVLPKKPRIEPVEDPRFPVWQEYPAKKPAAPVSEEGSHSREGTTSMPRQRAVQTVEVRVETHVGRRHVLEASSVTGHAHTESSISGSKGACPPVAAPVLRETRQSEPQTAAVKLQFDQNNLASGLLYGEILGKPKALRR